MVYLPTVEIESLHTKEEPLLIGNVLPTDTGIRIFDVDGSSIRLTAEDALKLAQWIRKKDHYSLLLEKMRQQERTQRRQRNETPDVHELHEPAQETS